MLEVPRSLLQSAVMLDPWLPDGIAYESSTYVGKVGETGERAYTHRFRLNYRGEIEHVSVGCDENTSLAHIEDMAFYGAERMMKRIDEKLQKRGNRLTPEDLTRREHWDTRKELAGALRDLRSWQRKRKGSSNGKTMYRGLR